MKLRDWPEFDLIRPAGANRLIIGFKTVRTIETNNSRYLEENPQCGKMELLQTTLHHNREFPCQ